jgi:hypothetical protein
VDLPGGAGLALTAIALSAACGFRIFIPPLGLAVAAALGIIELPASLAWLASPQAMALLGLASAIEMAGFLVPWFDNLLDTLATPAAVVAGVLLSAAVLADFDPSMRWALALIAGGGASGAVQASTASLRLLSSASTGGLANILVAMAELGLALVMTLAALLLPAMAVGVVLVLVLMTAVSMLRRHRRVRRER